MKPLSWGVSGNLFGLH